MFTIKQLSTWIYGPSEIKRLKQAERKWKEIIADPNATDVASLGQVAKNHLPGLRIGVGKDSTSFIPGLNLISLTPGRNTQATLAHEVVHACQHRFDSAFAKMRFTLAKINPYCLHWLFPIYCAAKKAYFQIYDILDKVTQDIDPEDLKSKEDAAQKFDHQVQSVLQSLSKRSLKLLKREYLHEIQAYGLTVQYGKRLNSEKDETKEEFAKFRLHRFFTQLIRKEERSRKSAPYA